jgi:ABC-type transport system involved in cytochrome c biogenesis ATPase subunit
MTKLMVWDIRRRSRSHSRNGANGYHRKAHRSKDISAKITAMPHPMSIRHNMAEVERLKFFQEIDHSIESIREQAQTGGEESASGRQYHGWFKLGR